MTPVSDQKRIAGSERDDRKESATSLLLRDRRPIPKRFTQLDFDAGGSEDAFRKPDDQLSVACGTYFVVQIGAGSMSGAG